MGYGHPQVIQGQAIGTFIAVFDSTALAALNPQGLAVGTSVYNTSVGSSFTLTVSNASLVPDSVVAVSGVTGLRWIVQAAAVVPVVTSAANGLATPAMFLVSPPRGADIPDADTTLQPFVDLCSEYVMETGVSTADRTVTMGVTSAIVSSFIQVCLVIKPQAHSITIKNDGGTTLYVAGPVAQTVVVSVFYSGTHFALNVAQFGQN